MNISSNISSIGSHQTAMNNGSSLAANTRVSDDNGSQRSQTDLAKELTDQISTENATAVNVTAIKTQDEMLGSLLDIRA